jgi:serine/threonine protein kinase
MSLVAHRGKFPDLQHYEILDKIADGSMATVYRAHSRTTDERVALKLPAREVAASPVLRKRFEEEFRVGSTLRHPGLVRALDFVREGEVFYLVMELVDGPDLWQRLQDCGKLPEAEAVRIIVQVAEALHEAHRHGIVHRDVKPDNILLAPDGRAKLGDLGLIKDLEGELGLTRTRKGLGTPDFMAPEQFEDASRVGAACDIYALGATLYTAVTGEIAFAARSLAAALRKKMNNELTPPRTLVPDLSERVDWAIRRALLANPRQRYATCHEFIQALTGEASETAAPRAQAVGSGRSGSAAAERRRWLRYPCTLVTVCEFNPSIHDDEAEIQDRWEGIVQNLSVFGAGLLLTRRFEPGATVNIILESPDHAFKRSLELRVRRVRRSGDGRWSTGGTFSEELTRDDLRKLL